MTSMEARKGKTISWKWNHHFHELEVTSTLKYTGYANFPEEEINTIRIPREIAIAMVKELHDEIEFQEAYDAHTETKGG